MPTVKRDGIEIPFPEPKEYEAFKDWAGKNKINEPFHPEEHYDTVNAFRKGINRDKGHFPDTYKLPGHPTFSNESMYYKPGMKAGRWEGDKYIPFKQGGLVMKRRAKKRLPKEMRNIKPIDTVPAMGMPMRGYQEGGVVKKETATGAAAGMLNDSRDWGKFRSATPAQKPATDWNVSKGYPRTRSVPKGTTAYPPQEPKPPAPPKEDALEWARKQNPRWRPEEGYDIKEAQRQQAQRKAQLAQPPRQAPRVPSKALESLGRIKRAEPLIKTGARTAGKTALRALGTVGAVAGDLIAPESAHAPTREHTFPKKSHGGQ